MQHTVTTAYRRRARKTARTRGQALVELAIVLPVFLVLVLAAIDLGRIFFARITVANSAREGAYEAAYGGSYVANSACGPSNSVMCAVLNESQSSLTVAPADVEWNCSGAGGCASGAYGDVVTVKVTGHFELLTPILAVFFGGTPIGSPIIGWVGETFGARWTILIATIACGITAVAAIIYVMRHDNLRLRMRASWARPVYLQRGPVLTEPIPEKVT